LERLSGTRIETNITTNNKKIISEFGLIDSWSIVSESDDGRMVAVEVELSDWFYNSVLGDSVLSIDKEYFNLRKPALFLLNFHCTHRLTFDDQALLKD
jgi:plasmid replication initiation protein